MKLAINAHEKQLVYKNFFDYFSMLLGAKEYQQCWYTRPEAPFPVFNSVIQTQLKEENMSEAIAQIKALYKDVKQFCWWLTDFATPHALKEKLEEGGFIMGSPFIGMIYSLTNKIIIPKELSNIEVKEITEPSQIQAWFKPVQHCFGIDEISSQFCIAQLIKHYNDTSLKHYYVEHQGAIVATGTLYIKNNISGFYNLGVLPEFRNKKIATALKWHRLKVSQESGASHAIIQSSEMGRQLDMAIGFKPVSEFVPYFSP